mmetsp:Transcript_10562/g.18062  ORF Transcript_10562/g.18062 Transcript_10562/m.18062 type:complete len:221 (+) Transcript_10562:216-878(+)
MMFSWPFGGFRAQATRTHAWCTCVLFYGAPERKPGGGGGTPSGGPESDCLQSHGRRGVLSIFADRQVAEFRKHRPVFGGNVRAAAQHKAIGGDHLKEMNRREICGEHGPVHSVCQRRIHLEIAPTGRWGALQIVRAGVVKLRCDSDIHGAAAFQGSTRSTGAQVRHVHGELVQVVQISHHWNPIHKRVGILVHQGGQGCVQQLQGPSQEHQIVHIHAIAA